MENIKHQHHDKVEKDLRQTFGEVSSPLLEYMTHSKLPCGTLKVKGQHLAMYYYTKVNVMTIPHLYR